MNTNHHDDEQLLWHLRGLRRETLPTGDLWPGIAARIGADPVGAAVAATQQPGERDRRHGGSHSHTRRRASRFAPWALAASLALAVGVAWQLRPESGTSPLDPSRQLVHREADALTREYDAALRELQAAGRPAAPVGGALLQLDQSAVQIRTALARDPDARFLLERLRRTYEKRLELTQRAVLS